MDWKKFREWNKIDSVNQVKKEVYVLTRDSIAKVHRILNHKKVENMEYENIQYESVYVENLQSDIGHSKKLS